MSKKRSIYLAHALLATMLVSFVLVTSGCGGSSQSQQQANQNKSQLDTALQHAKANGVPSSQLAPVVKKEQQLSSTSAPFSLFNDQPDTDYYVNQANQYHQLSIQLQGIVGSVTDQFSTQAQLDMQDFQQTLAVQTTKKVGNISAFTEQYNKDNALLTAAVTPKDYVTVSHDAASAVQALHLLASTFTQLTTFKTTINQMQKANLDVTAMQTQYKGDVATFNIAVTPLDFQHLGGLIDAQYSMAVANSMLALPYVGAAKLSEFKTQLNLLKTYGMDNSAYLKLYSADQTAMKKASSISEYLSVSTKINADIASMHNDLVQGAASYLVGELDREARAWGKAHLYHDKFDGNNYILDAGYTSDGIGYWINRDLGWAYTPDDFQAVVDQENDEFFNLQMLEQDYSDKTPYNQVHQTDLEMFQHYPSLKHGMVLMVSFVEQAMRVYDNGKLINAFLVTTGRVERPALPGIWSVQDRKSPDEFKSDDPPGSPFWYPPTPIHYAILYHWGGFFVHDAWWRVNFGPGTQFPHYDVGGDESFAGNGSHGCINMQEQQAAWVYSHTDWNTQIAVY
ncbi:MAG TPA: L,D-transpeptidase [Ktedonobacteraceae bacterium]|nr:L,D-transpeptidase [Ktedonobacteraceae bacterium]